MFGENLVLQECESNTEQGKLYFDTYKVVKVRFELVYLTPESVLFLLYCLKYG